MRRIIERINRHIPKWIRQNKIVSSILVLLYTNLAQVDEDFKEQLFNAIQMYIDDSVDERKLYHDMICEFVTSWVRPVEYTRFVFFDKSRPERNTYIADYEEVMIYKRTKGNNILPDSKYERYLMFEKYFQREVICVSSQTNISEDEYQQFILDKEKVIIKPLKGTKGHGVVIVDTNSIPTLTSFIKQYSSECLIEQIIHQGSELKQFHPDSVNTVRFVTGIDHKKKFHYIFALVRMGQGNSVVDNVSNGGLVALIDLKKGEICSAAYQGTKSFNHHPDTGVALFGVKIPQWKELCDLVKEMHLGQPGQRVFGFDMAWTETGWDLVEVNPAPSFDSYQVLTGKGIRPFLDGIQMI